MEKEKRDKLILDNVNLIYKIANSFYLQNYYSKEDIIQYGMEALIMAADKYDETKGFKFSTYAYLAIKRKILRSTTKDMLIRVPENKMIKIAKLNQRIKDLEQEKGTILTLEEITELLNIPIEDIYEAQNIIKKVVSLNTSTDDTEDELINFIEIDTTEEKVTLDFNQIFKEADLTDKQKQVMILLLGINCKPIIAEHIAKLMNCSKENIRSMIARSIRKMFKSKTFANYFEEEARNLKTDFDILREEYANQNPSERKIIKIK